MKNLGLDVRKPWKFGTCLDPNSNFAFWVLPQARVFLAKPQGPGPRAQPHAPGPTFFRLTRHLLNQFAGLENMLLNWLSGLENNSLNCFSGLINRFSGFNKSVFRFNKSVPLFKVLYESTKFEI